MILVFFSVRSRVTVGVVIAVADLILPEKHIGDVRDFVWRTFSWNTFFLISSIYAKIFSLYLLIPGLVWFAVLHVDLRRHTNAVNEHQQAESAWTDESKDYTSLSTAVNGYTFRRGRHSGSFFLKIGAAGNKPSYNNFLKKSYIFRYDLVSESNK